MHRWRYYRPNHPNVRGNRPETPMFAEVILGHSRWSKKYHMKLCIMAIRKNVVIQGTPKPSTFLVNSWRCWFFQGFHEQKSYISQRNSRIGNPLQTLLLSDFDQKREGLVRVVLSSPLTVLQEGFFTEVIQLFHHRPPHEKEQCFPRMCNVKYWFLSKKCHSDLNGQKMRHVKWTEIIITTLVPNLLIRRGNYLFQ